MFSLLPRSPTVLTRASRTGLSNLASGRRLYQESAPTKAAAAALATAEPSEPPSFHAEATYPRVASIGEQARPQLDILKRKWEPEYYDGLSKIMRLRRKYLRDSNVFVEGEEMIPLLRNLGATEEDLERLQTVSDHLYSDPTLPFRRSRNGRFGFDIEAQTVQRLEFQPFALSIDEDFKRHDSGQVRIFDEVEGELQYNTAFQALLVFKGAMIHGVPITPRAKLDYKRNKWVTTLFNLRTVTTPDLLGEPALEGVHTDGVDHTMTTYLGSNNMLPKSAVTYMHDMAEQTGVRFRETKTELVKARAHHRHFLDTLVIADNENKHSISPVFAVDPAREATRDMLIFFTRRPVEADHISGSIDSLTPHKRLPMSVPLFIPPQ